MKVFNLEKELFLKLKYCPQCTEIMELTMNGDKICCICDLKFEKIIEMTPTNLEVPEDMESGKITIDENCETEYHLKNEEKQIHDNISVNEKGGMKQHKGKLRYELLKPLYKVLDEIVGVLTYGSTKYSDHNWQKVAKEYYEGAAGRHVSKYNQGKRIDVGESERHHLSCAIVDYMFVLWHDMKEHEENKHEGSNYTRNCDCNCDGSCGGTCICCNGCCGRED